MDIKNRWSGDVLSTADEGETLSEAVQRIVKERNLRAADLRDADLRAADLRDANLSAANLRDANLSAANLRDANLRAADLRDANLRAADLRAADLRAADLRCKQYVARIQGRRHEINVINDDVRIGCIRKPLAEWLRCYEVVGKENNYTPFEIAEYGVHLRHIAEVLKLWSEAAENTEKKTVPDAD